MVVHHLGAAISLRVYDARVEACLAILNDPELLKPMRSSSIGP